MIRCNTEARWIPNLKGYAQAAAQAIERGQQNTSGKEGQDDPAARRWAEKVILGYLVRAVYQEVQPHNLGVVRLRGRSYRDEHGDDRPLLVFRSGVTFGPEKKQSCLNTLIHHGGVKHVINLYDGTFPLHDLVDKERQVALRLGATHHDERIAGKPWRGMIKKPEGYRANLPIAMQRVAKLIREQILAPGGRPPRGNIHLHCGGGMHRSGMIFGILRRCINHDPMSLIEAEYNRHTAFGSCGKTGCGHEPLNVQFIRDFDCALLRR